MIPPVIPAAGPSKISVIYRRKRRNPSDSDRTTASTQQLDFVPPWGSQGSAPPWATFWSSNWAEFSSGNLPTGSSSSSATVTTSPVDTTSPASHASTIDPSSSASSTSSSSSQAPLTSSNSPTPSPANQNLQPSKTGIIIGSVLGALAFLGFAFLLLACYMYRRRRLEHTKKSAENGSPASTSLVASSNRLRAGTRTIEPYNLKHVLETEDRPESGRNSVGTSTNDSSRVVEQLVGLIRELEARGNISSARELTNANEPPPGYCEEGWCPRRREGESLG